MRRYEAAGLRFEAVGGVEAVRRLAEGEALDLAVLDAKSVNRLCSQGRLDASHRLKVARSSVVMAVRAYETGAVLSSVDALKAMLLRAQGIGYSTGPSGAALLDLFERWGLMSRLACQLIQLPPGVPLAELLLKGRVSFGFQQANELVGIDGIEVIRALPAAGHRSKPSSTRCRCSDRGHPTSRKRCATASPTLPRPPRRRLSSAISCRPPETPYFARCWLKNSAISPKASRVSGMRSSRPYCACD